MNQSSPFAQMDRCRQLSWMKYRNSCRIVQLPFGFVGRTTEQEARTRSQARSRKAAIDSRSTEKSHDEPHASDEYRRLQRCTYQSTAKCLCASYNRYTTASRGRSCATQNWRGTQRSSHLCRGLFPKDKSTIQLRHHRTEDCVCSKASSSYRTRPRDALW